MDSNARPPFPEFTVSLRLTGCGVKEGVGVGVTVGVGVGVGYGPRSEMNGDKTLPGTISLGAFV